ncbi:MAG: ABC transporter permease [Kiritimatiellaeota bacterium]|nr:ABC transporter permease [Kiritimatiellota bacterium]
MTFASLILRSLRFYWRTNLGVFLGVAVAGAILTGALVVGDSVRASLRQAARARLGSTQLALAMPDRFFRAALATEMQADLHATVAPLLLLRGTVTLPDGSARANAAQVVGVEERFWRMGGASNLLAAAGSDEAVISSRLAQQLGVGAGETLVVRVEQPALISRDVPLSGRSDLSVALRLRVRAIASDHDFGRFGLRADQTPPASVFLTLATLQAQLKRAGQANILLTDATAGADAALRRHWQLADAGLETRALPDGATLELNTPQVFLVPAIVLAADSNATGVLTYFVNELRRGDHTTPYSFVAAAGSALKDDEITLNAWLAEDLGAKVGDDITLRYFVIGERRELREATAKFHVRAITPLTRDESWMPAFPGLADVHNCNDWQPGIPIDHDRIRPKDEAYWNDYRGTPKAFISLAAGQRLFGNRFGNLTALRLPAREFSATNLLARLDPAALGLGFVPVRAAALAASGQALDFGQLFIGFSFFLIVAALLLTALLFAFNLEQRNAEVGLLRALGWRSGQIRRLLASEGFVLAILGTLAGLVLGAAYTRLPLLCLATVWRGATGALPLVYHAEPLTLALGAVLNLLAAGTALALVQRSQTRRAPASLLASGMETEMPRGKGRWGWVTGSVFLLGALALLATAGHAQDQQAAETFFSAGACLLIAGLGFSSALLAALTRMARTAGTLAGVGLRNAARRQRRSLTVISVLASGVFLLVAVSAFHQDARPGTATRSSGTGGFALFAQSTLPVYDDLNSAAGRALYSLSAEELAGVSLVPLRVREGDDASCLNLNRAQQPRLYGVQPAMLAQRKAFHFATTGVEWSRLEQTEGDGAIPAVGDEPTVTWALGKKVGDEVALTDDQGHAIKLRIVGVLGSSVLQGGLLISEKNFVAHFPASSGYRAFLVDTPPARAGNVAATLTRALGNRGLEVVPAWRRLAEFMAVENAYLGIFQALGGLGLVLGSLGLALVVLRNVLERRGELALLLALGFRRRALQRLVLAEHWLLIFLGLALGLGAAVLAVWPAWRAAENAVPWGLLSGALGALAAGGLLWTWLAARAALRGPLLAALRNE